MATEKTAKAETPKAQSGVKLVDNTDAAHVVKVNVETEAYELTPSLKQVNYKKSMTIPAAHSVTSTEGAQALSPAEQTSVAVGQRGFSEPPHVTTTPPRSAQRPHH